MRRLNLDSIQVDTTKKKNQLIKSTLQLASEYRGNFLNNMVCPITYNELSNNVIYYDGAEYTLNGTTVYKNGVEIFKLVDDKHLELEETTSVVSKSVDGSNRIIGTIIYYYFTYSLSGTISDITCSYDYVLCADYIDGVGYVTLFPTKPTSYKEIQSWKITESGVLKTSDVFLNPAHELIRFVNNRCIIDNSRAICEVIFQDFLLSGDHNHVMYTAKNDDGYFYSNLELLFTARGAKEWITSDCLMLATTSDGIYYGGFKVEYADGWSIDYYNNVPVQISYKGKVMINQIDYAWFTADGISVVVKDKAYNVILSQGVQLSIVADRYIVANSPSTYLNTYDMQENKAFCRNNGYNGCLLWLLPEEALTTDVDKRGTFYVATGVNTQGQVQGDVVQGTLWPSFPVWGLENNNFKLLDYWNETSRATVQVYKGTVNSPTVPEFAFSLGGYLDYTGYVYPDSSNTLYSVAEIDTFNETYSGVQLIKTPVGNFLTAMNNVQSLSFSYYIGTLTELKAVFVLRGTVYGVSNDGYIISMTLDGNTITGTSLVTKSGYFTFIGNTQDYALFFNSYEKMIYQFDAGLKLTALKEFSIADIKYYTCRAEDDKIAIATSDSIYVLSNSSVYRIESSVNSLRYCKKWLLAGNRAYSSYDGDYTLAVEYDSGKQGSTYDTSVQLDEVDVMLDDSDLKVPPYLEYRIDIDTAIGEVKEITPDCSNIIRLKPTATRNEGLYYRLWLKTNCNLMGISVQDNAEKKPNLTRNNG